MKKIVLTTILLASCVSWAQSEGPKETGGGVNALGHTPCCEQEVLPGTRDNVDHAPGQRMPKPATTSGNTQDNDANQKEGER